MTATTPDTGLRARVQRFTRTAAVFAIALGVCGFASPAVAADGDDPNDAGSVELHLSLGIHGKVLPGTGTTASLSVQNETDSQLSAGQVLIELNRTPLADDDAVTTWLDDSEASGDFVELGSDSADAVDAGNTESVSIDVPLEALAGLAPGVYPVRAALSGATTGDPGNDLVDRDATTESVLVVTAESTQVGVLVPITASPADGVLLSADELSTLTAVDGDLTAALDGVTGTAAVLAIDPSIVAAIRALGTSAPSSATDWLARLDELPNERFALQFGDADATVQAQAQLAQLLQPTTLQTALSPQNFPSAPATGTPAPAGVTPAPTPTQTDAPVLPTDEELTAIDGAVDSILWPHAGATTGDLATFDAYLGGTATTILSSSAIEGAAAAHATADGHDLLVVDDTASASISRAASEDDADARQRWLAATSAHLFLAAQDAPQTPLLVGLTRDQTRDATALREAIGAVDSIGFDLTSVRATAPTAVTLAPTDADTAAVRVAALQSLLADEGTLATFATILTDPQLLLSRERIRVLREIAVGVPDAKFSENVQAHRDATDDTLHAVSIPPSSTIQLLSANADLPFSIKNDLPWPVTLRLAVAPTDPRLDVQASTDVVVQPNTSARVKVPVSARVGSGEVGLRLNIYSPTGVLIDGPQTVRVAVRAEWETIGLIIFGSLAVLLIVGGVVRTVHRRRREAAEEEQAAETVEQGATTSDE